MHVARCVGASSVGRAELMEGGGCGSWADRYHLGSIAFGSLIIAIVQMIRIALAYLDQKTKSMQVSGVLHCRALVMRLSCACRALRCGVVQSGAEWCGAVWQQTNRLRLPLTLCAVCMCPEQEQDLGLHLQVGAVLPVVLREVHQVHLVRASQTCSRVDAGYSSCMSGSGTRLQPSTHVY